MAEDLFVRIRHALETPKDSGEIAMVISSVRAAVDDNRHWRSEHEAAILDPLADTAAVKSADAALADTHLQERRLAEAERRLEIKLAEVREVETESEARERFARAKAIRDKVAAEVRDAWTKHAKGLVAVVERIERADAEVAQICGKPPHGEAPPDSVIAGHVLPGMFTNGVVPFHHHLNLPEAFGAPGYRGAYVKARMG